MYISRQLAMACAALAFCLAHPALAHHSFTMFDMEKDVKLEGTVKEIQWTNPHVWVQLMVKDAATGADVEWSIETGSPNMLSRAGWSRNSLKVGDKAAVVIHPLKGENSKHSGTLASLTVNGKRILSGQAPEEGQ